MNTKVYIVKSEYDFDAAPMTAVDVPPIPFLNCRNPLYVGVKTSQVSRMNKYIQQEKLAGTAIGFWEMNPNYMSRKGKLNWQALQEHDVVFLSSSERADSKYKEKYEEMIQAIEGRLK
jgi:hypothetical protein